MTDTELWGQFAIGVLTHPDLAAGATAENLDTLWGWGNAETAPYPLMRWNNPQNTTEKWPGSRDSGAQPGNRDVQIYASLQDGINATVATLVNGYYGAIVANLRASLPRQQWGLYSTAATELHAWGTGSAWLTSTPYFGALPDSVQGADMTPLQEQYLFRIFNLLLHGSDVDNFPNGVGSKVAPYFQTELDQIKAAVATIQSPPAATIDLAPALAAIAAEHDAVTALTTALANDDADLDTALGNLSTAVNDVKTHVAHLT